MTENVWDIFKEEKLCGFGRKIKCIKVLGRRKYNRECKETIDHNMSSGIFDYVTKVYNSSQTFSKI